MVTVLFEVLIKFLPRVAARNFGAQADTSLSQQSLCASSSRSGWCHMLNSACAATVKNSEGPTCKSLAIPGSDDTELFSRVLGRIAELPVAAFVLRRLPVTVTRGFWVLPLDRVLLYFALSLISHALRSCASQPPAHKRRGIRRTGR